MYIGTFFNKQNEINSHSETQVYTGELSEGPQLKLKFITKRRKKEKETKGIWQ